MAAPSAVKAVARLIQSVRASGARSSSSCGTLELEARLGRLSGSGGFVSGVSAAEFARIVGGLERCTAWTAPPQLEWLESRDYTTAAGVRVTSGAAADSPVAALKKTACATENLAFVSAAPRTDGHHDVRVRLSLEEPAAAVAAAVPTVHVRIKQRKSFVYKEWRVDATRCWAGDTLQAAEEARAQGRALHEVEVECVDAAVTLRQHADEHVAESLLLKVCALMHVEHDFTIQATCA
jgi:hypothetical protein